MSKILISGCAGLIGSHLTDYLLKEGHEVVGLDVYHFAKRSNIPPDIKYYDLDIRHYDSLGKAFEGVDIVYHCAAYAAEIMSLFRPCFVNEVNVQGSINLITHAVNSKVKRFVFTSSNATYGYQEKVPYDETVLREPKDPYGLGKKYIEDMLKIMQEAHGLDYSIVYPHNVYGSRQNITDPYRNVLGIWFNRIQHNLPPMVYGDGLQKRSFTYIDDFTWALGVIGEMNSTKNKAFNIGSDEAITLDHAAEKVCEVMDFKEGHKHTDDRPQEVKVSYPSHEKAKKTFGYEAKVGFDEGITKMAEWVKTQPIHEFVYFDDVEIENKLPKVWKEKLL